ncbi:MULTISPECIES: hypothetical protein [unclassified Rhizobacter]|uniref:hypothetical protein n=1 Tax=unclassified Rhizobacter TaxID=2640088 RepID=UPI0006F6A478|nr:MULTISPECIES: hypothetical protein [unclassified Rhizobacter]KQU80728.1 hypothetical protein ASC88_14285 [Rhizobacter sp. Root29]KQW04271.1 hypothetical protein ASC98_03975 [Rhizobacter sp. Root1238]KRB14607.1 hypothetical protein ASE08_09215 [Rhizobacter sp. Root16D2]
MTATHLTRLTLIIATLSAATVLLCQPRAQADEQVATAVITMPAVTVTGKRMQVVVMPQVVVTGKRDVSDLQLAQQARAVRGTRG